MSSTNLASTLLFNRVSRFGLSPYQPYYENYIVGGVYQRDVNRLGGFVIAGEVGLADRFGHYTDCCAPIEKTTTSSSIVNSGELWLGPAFRYEAIVFFKTVRFVPGITAGFSLVTNSIGAEEGHVELYHGNATFLGYLGFEAAFSLVSAPALELIIGEHHRSRSRWSLSASFTRVTTPTSSACATDSERLFRLRRRLRKPGTSQ